MLFGPIGHEQKRQKRAKNALQRPASGKGGQTPLKPPPCVTPPLAVVPCRAPDRIDFTDTGSTDSESILISGGLSSREGQDAPDS